MIILLRKLIKADKIIIGKPMPNLSKLSSVDFNAYKSSQYADMASHMAEILA